MPVVVCFFIGPALQLLFSSFSFSITFDVALSWFLNTLRVAKFEGSIACLLTGQIPALLHKDLTASGLAIYATMTTGAKVFFDALTSGCWKTSFEQQFFHSDFQTSENTNLQAGMHVIYAMVIDTKDFVISTEDNGFKRTAIHGHRRGGEECFRK